MASKEKPKSTWQPPPPIRRKRIRARNERHSVPSRLKEEDQINALVSEGGGQLPRPDENLVDQIEIDQLKAAGLGPTTRSRHRKRPPQLNQRKRSRSR